MNKGKYRNEQKESVFFMERSDIYSVKYGHLKNRVSNHLRHKPPVTSVND